MSSLNITAICGMTQDQAITEISKSFVNTRLIILFFAIFLAIGVIGTWRIKNSRPLFFSILGLAFVISLCVLGFMTILPITTQSIINNVTTFIGG